MRALELKPIIGCERQTGRCFTRAFTDFAEFARRSINPNVADAAEIEKVIGALASQSFSRTPGTCKPPPCIISSTH